jgi:hypothetical protein
VNGKNGDAMMMSGWIQSLDEFSLKKRETCIFSFRDQIVTRFKHKKARLKLVILSLDK